MDRARDDYTREERSKLEELERNKRRQRELEDELRMLKARGVGGGEEEEEKRRRSRTGGGRRRREGICQYRQ